MRSEVEQFNQKPPPTRVAEGSFFNPGLESMPVSTWNLDIRSLLIIQVYVFSLDWCVTIMSEISSLYKIRRIFYLLVSSHFFSYLPSVPLLQLVEEVASSSQRQCQLLYTEWLSLPLPLPPPSSLHPSPPPPPPSSLHPSPPPPPPSLPVSPVGLRLLATAVAVGTLATTLPGIQSNLRIMDTLGASILKNSHILHVESRVSWVQIPPRAANFSFLWKKGCPGCSGVV